ncbi:MAG: hypothetical protein H6718_27085 [Polyangiaceae bacterium]|nr:hypothetical protein [Myxococcales bacterium]MCB9589108.1 hypothetical protein [Polyangiaceae bacterium]
MNRFSLVTLLGLGIAQLAACGGDSSDDGSGGAGNAGNAGSAGSAGVAGSAGNAGAGTGGEGGTLNATRKCGLGIECEAGDTCKYSGFETGVTCDCDPSGHFLCDSGGAGAPPFEPCNERAASGQGGSCRLSNGYCTRTCTESACEVTCDGEPATVEWAEECAPSMCGLDYWGWGGCEISTGPSCSYQIDCSEPGKEYAITGTCE